MPICCGGPSTTTVRDWTRSCLCPNTNHLMDKRKPSSSTIGSRCLNWRLRIETLAIETIELERKGISYTYDTMKILTEQHPDTDYYFIIGADMVDYLPKWYRIDELVDMVQFVGVQRPRYKAGTSYPVIWVDASHGHLVQHGA